MSQINRFGRFVPRHLLEPPSTWCTNSSRCSRPNGYRMVTVSETAWIPDARQQLWQPENVRPSTKLHDIPPSEIQRCQTLPRPSRCPTSDHRHPGPELRGPNNGGKTEVRSLAGVELLRRLPAKARNKSTLAEVIVQRKSARRLSINTDRPRVVLQSPSSMRRHPIPFEVKCPLRRTSDS